MHKSKLYRSQLATYEREDVYELAAAVAIIKKMPHAKFDETVELSVRLGIDPRQSDQNVRGAMVLPHGTGKSVRIVVIADGEAAQAAREAGADEVGVDDVIAKIESGWAEFDTLIATPSAMGKVRRLGRFLGPRGLMPNPKTGTVTDDTGTAVQQAKAGKIEYRADKTGGCVHLPVGKVSFTPDQLRENCEAVVGALLRARPAAAKGQYMLSCTISSTMSPGVHVDPRQFTRR